MTEAEVMRGRQKYKTFKYLENEKNFLDEVKSNLHNYLSVIIC